MLHFHCPQIIREESTARLETVVTENFPDGRTIEHQVWCETGIEYADGLCDERCDALLIGLFPYAILNGHDIVSDAPATRELLYNLKEVWLPLLLQTSKKAHAIQLNIPVADEPLPNLGAVGTGISLGIDSFYTIFRHAPDSDSLIKITHLCFFNVGSHGTGESAVKRCQEHERKVRAFADEYHYPLVTIDSNFADEFKQHHEYIHAYASAFAVFSLQKLWKDYFYASAGFAPGKIDLKNWDRRANGNYTLLLPEFISTGNLNFRADAEHATRLQKTAYLATFPAVWKHLLVCIGGIENCCRCKKCVRTILTLKALGKRAQFAQVFPPKKESFWINLKWLFKGIKKRDFYIMEIVKHWLSGKKI